MDVTNVCPTRYVIVLRYGTETAARKPARDPIEPQRPSLMIPRSSNFSFEQRRNPVNAPNTSPISARTIRENAATSHPI